MCPESVARPVLYCAELQCMIGQVCEGKGSKWGHERKETKETMKEIDPNEH